jgi:hypothetical protein
MGSFAIGRSIAATWLAGKVTGGWGAVTDVIAAADFSG